MERRVLLLSPLEQLSGNFATITRIKNGLEKHGIWCVLECPLQLQIDRGSLIQILGENNIGLVVAVHAYKSGKLLAGISTPYIIIIGGTDVNVSYTDENKMMVMSKAVLNSSGVVAFSESLVHRFKECWPDYSHQNITMIPQGVQVFPSEFSIKTYIECNGSASDNAATSEDGRSHRPDALYGQDTDRLLYGQDTAHLLYGQDTDRLLYGQDTAHLLYGQDTDRLLYGQDTDRLLYGQDTDHLINQLSESDAKLFTIVGGIRPVKNPLLLVNKFSEWRSTKQRSNCWLLFVGAHQNDEFLRGFVDEVLRCRGVVYIPGLSMEDTHAVIRSSTALVNSSDSEGMALAILESMAMGTPVIVRNIPGNTAIVQDGQTGLVFDSPQAFFEKADYLLDNPDVIHAVTHNALNYISQKHSAEVEEKSYLSLVKKYCLLEKQD